MSNEDLAHILRSTLIQLKSAHEATATVDALKMHTDDYDMLVQAFRFAGCAQTADTDLLSETAKHMCGIKILVDNSLLPGVIEALDRDGKLVYTMEGLA